MDIYEGLVEPGKSLFDTNPFANQLRNLGLFSALGPQSALGPLGVLGALGPIGATGYKRDLFGNFLDKNNHTVRTIEVQYDSETTRVYPLYEFYSDAKKVSMNIQDTSFSVRGILPKGKECRNFTVYSDYN